MARLAILIDTDVSLRHFVKTGTFSGLEKIHDVRYFIKQDGTSKDQLSLDKAKAALSESQIVNIPRKRTGRWYALNVATVLCNHRHDNESLRSKNAQFQSMVSAKLFRVSQCMAFPLINPIVRLIWKICMGVWKPLYEALREVGPDLIILPCPLNGPFMYELMPVAKKLGVPALVLQNSWDNTSSRAFLTGLPDYLGVWGGLTRRQAVEFMRMPPDRVKILGAAQFDCYRENPSNSFSEIRNYYGVAEGKKVIVYAGAGNGAHESWYLGVMNELCHEGLWGDAHIVYRPHPWRGPLATNEKNFFEMGLSHVTMDPELVEYYQREISSPTGKPCILDYEKTHELLSTTDFMVSPCSTILLEAAMHGIPCVTVFPDDDANEVRFNANVQIFEIIIGANRCRQSEGKDGLKKAVQMVLANPKMKEEIKERTKDWVFQSEKPYRELLADLVGEILNNNTNL